MIVSSPKVSESIHERDVKRRDLITFCFISWMAARRIAVIDKADIKVKLMLCGSRGVGAIAMASEGVTSIELLDIEEDEEEDEDCSEDEDQ